MKKFIYALILPLVVVSGLLVFANRENSNETSKNSTPVAAKKPSTTQRCDEMKTEREKWEASPEGIKYINWTVSPEGKKVLDGAAKIREHVAAFSDMEAVVTSLSLPPGSRLGFGVMARIDGVDYIVRFDPEKSQLEQLQSLKANDKIIIRSKVVSHAPKYKYPIVRADYVERDGKVIFKYIPPKDGC